MNNKILAVAAVIVLLIAGVAVWQMGATDDSDNDYKDGDKVTVKDMLGYDVTVTLPVKKVAIGASPTIDVFSQVVGEGWEDLVCMMPADLKDREPSKMAIFQEKYPELMEKPLVPDFMKGLPTQEVIEQSPDLFIVPSGYVFQAGMENEGKEWIKDMNEAGIAVFCIDFFKEAFTHGLAERTYGQLGKLMQTTDRTDKIIDYYNKSLDYVLDKIEPVKKEFTYLTEVHMSSDLTTYAYSSVPMDKAPEAVLLGGKCANTDPSKVYGWTMADTMAADPDYYFFCATSYNGGHGILGHNLFPTDDECKAEFEDLNKREGWTELKAVQDNHLDFVYGELRNSLLGMVDLYHMAMYIYPDQITQEDLDEVFENMDKISPYGFKGKFHYDPVAA